MTSEAVLVSVYRPLKMTSEAVLMSVYRLLGCSR